MPRPRHLKRYALLVMNPARLKFLGIYLIVICSLQICLYAIISFNPKDLGVLFYFDPRIGIFFLETAFRGSEQIAPGVFRWLSAAWILTLGIILFSGRPLLKTYIVSEIVFALPSLLFGLVVVIAGLSAAHGFSVPELFFPILIMLFFSIIPLVLAIRLAWRSRFKGDLKIFE